MTKKSIVTLALLSIFTLISSSALAAGPTTNRRTSPPPATGSSYVSEPYSGGGSSTFSLGYSTGSAGGALGTQAVSALIGLRNGNMIDIRFAIPNTNGSFAFGAGGLYKHVISTHGSAGFHLGGGAALGSVTTAAGGTFALTIAAIAGFHFQVPSVSAISVHIDGGPAFSLLSTEPNSTTNFALQAFSGLLGMSIYYTF